MSRLQVERSTGLYTDVAQSESNIWTMSRLSVKTARRAGREVREAANSTAEATASASNQRMFAATEGGARRVWQNPWESVTGLSQCTTTRRCDRVLLLSLRVLCRYCKLQASDEG